MNPHSPAWGVFDEAEFLKVIQQEADSLPVVPIMSAVFPESSLPEAVSALKLNNVGY
jgi:hypothetical protein